MESGFLDLVRCAENGLQSIDFDTPGDRSASVSSRRLRFVRHCTGNASRRTSLLPTAAGKGAGLIQSEANIQWVSRCSVSAIFNCWDLPLGYSMGGPADQLLRSSTSGMCNLLDIQWVAPRYSASGICLWDIQWVVPLQSASAIFSLRDLQPLV